MQEEPSLLSWDRYSAHVEEDYQSGSLKSMPVVSTKYFAAGCKVFRMRWLLMLQPLYKDANQLTSLMLQILEYHVLPNVVLYAENFTNGEVLKTVIPDTLTVGASAPPFAQLARQSFATTAFTIPRTFDVKMLRGCSDKSRCHASSVHTTKSDSRMNQWAMAV